MQAGGVHVSPRAELCTVSAVFPAAAQFPWGEAGTAVGTREVTLEGHPAPCRKKNESSEGFEAGE